MQIWNACYIKLGKGGEWEADSIHTLMNKRRGYLLRLVSKCWRALERVRVT